METKANPIIVGIFTLAALVGAFSFIWWLGSYGERGSQETYRVVFAGDVSGLNDGGPVLFNGIKVGTISSIGFAPFDPTQVIVDIKVSENTPVKVDTTAQIHMTGLTGGAVLMLRSGESDTAALKDTWDDPDSPPVIFADGTGLQNLMDAAQKLIGRVDGVAARLDTLIANNETAVTRTISNVEEFSKALADRSDSVGKLLDDAASAARGIASLSEKLEPVAEKLDRMIAAVEPEDVGQTIANLREFSDSVAAKKDQFSVFMDEASQAATRLNELADKLQVAGDDVVKFAGALDSDSINRSIGNVETFTNTLSENSQTVDQFIEDAGAIAKQLRGTSVRLDALLAKVDGMVGADGSGFIENISEAAKSFREMSDNLNTRLDVIGKDIQRFSGRGLRDVEAFVADGRRALRSVERVLTDFERNPSKFILQGGSNVREYKPRR